MTSKIEVYESDLPSIKEDAKVFFHVLTRMVNEAEHINAKGYDLTEAMLGIEEWESVDVNPLSLSVADKYFMMPDGTVRNRFKIDMYCKLLGYKSHRDLICEVKSSVGKYRPPIHSSEDFIRVVTFIQIRLLNNHYPKVFFEEFFKELRAYWPTPSFQLKDMLYAESVKICRSRNAGSVVRVSFVMHGTKEMITCYSSLGASLISSAERALSGMGAQLPKGLVENVYPVRLFSDIRFCNDNDGNYLVEIHRDNKSIFSISITRKHLQTILSEIQKMMSNKNWKTSEDVLDVVSPNVISCQKPAGSIVELESCR